MAADVQQRAVASVASPMPSASGLARPASTSPPSTGWPRVMVPSGPVQLMTCRTCSTSSPRWPRGRRRTSTPDASSEKPWMRAAWSVNWPSRRSRSTVSPMLGAIRWRCTSQYARRCRRKRCRSPTGSRCHSGTVTGRSASTTVRQSAPAS
ncbi:hypothetical protein ACLEPN_18180, partial [Myxococcus sp. 1LA]